MGLENLSRQDIELILETAKSFKEVSSRDIKKVPALRGKTVVTLFFEPSTRTRISFELAAKRLSADTLNIAANVSSTSKGETLLDTARNIEAMNVDAMVVRHSSSGSVLLLAEGLKCSVVNAGDGCREHPTQALLDMFTLQEKFGRIEGLKVGIIGDILHSRVARSNIWGLTSLGAKVTVCGPATLMPRGIEALGVDVCYDLKKVLKQSDAVIALRLQKERQQDKFLPSMREYSRLFGINQAKLNEGSDHLIVMHPGPTNRGVELSADVADGKQSVILDQVTNGVAVRMAVLYLVLGTKYNVPLFFITEGRGIFMGLLIKNAIIVNADKIWDKPQDILCEEGKITQIAAGITAGTHEIIDAAGKKVLPGLIDIHTHLRQPGREDKETIETGSRAAVKGGFTSIMCMPNTNPVIDNAMVVEFIIREANRVGLCNVYPIGAITKGQQDGELTDMAELKAAGCLAFSDDGKSVLNSRLFRLAMEYAKMLDVLIIEHCQDPLLSAGGVMNEGVVSTKIGLKGDPGIAETVTVARDIEIALYLECPGASGAYVA